MNQSNLNEILEQHEIYIESHGSYGEIADLSYADLSYANLSDTDLSYANLIGAERTNQ